MTSLLATLPTTQPTTPLAKLDMRINRTLSGPNIWSDSPMIEVRLDTATFPFRSWNVANDLLESLGLEPVHLDDPDGAESAAEWISAAAIRLQKAAGSPVRFSQWRRSDNSSSFEMFIEYEEPKLAAAVVELLVNWLNLLARPSDSVASGPVPGGPAIGRYETCAVTDEWNRFLDRAFDLRLGNTTGAITRSAATRGVPYLRLDDESLVQLGQGRHQRRVRMATTNCTGSIANWIATDKQLTKRLLQAVGIPVPVGQLVSDARDACRVATELGWPVVVKPADSDFGHGVSIRLTTAEEVHAAYSVARRWSERVLVERFVPGTLYRLLVVGGRLVGAVRRESAFVIGDGRRTILELVHEAHFDPQRGADYVSPLRQMELAGGDLPTLAYDGSSNDTVPASDQTVSLTGDIFLRSGGTQVDRTCDVHPEMAALAIDVAAIVGLDVAGLDVIAHDLTQSPSAQSFAVLEVNSEPAIVLHMEPCCTPPGQAAEAIVESMFPHGQTGRVPLIAVLGPTANLEFAQQVAAEHRKQGETVGLASRDGAWLDGRSLGPSDDHVGQHTKRLWRHPRTDIVVVHLTLEDVLREGIPFFMCDQLFEVESFERLCSSLTESCELDQRRALECLRRTVEVTVGQVTSPGNQGREGLETM